MNIFVFVFLALILISCGGGEKENEGSDIAYVVIENSNTFCGDEEDSEDWPNQFTLGDNGIDVISSKCYFVSTNLESSGCRNVSQEFVHEIYSSNLTDAENLGYRELDGTELEQKLWSISLLESQCEQI